MTTVNKKTNSSASTKTTREKKVKQEISPVLKTSISKVKVKNNEFDKETLLQTSPKIIPTKVKEKTPKVLTNKEDNNIGKVDVKIIKEPENNEKFNGYNSLSTKKIQEHCRTHYNPAYWGLDKENGIGKTNYFYRSFFPVDLFMSYQQWTNEQQQKINENFVLTNKQSMVDLLSKNYFDNLVNTHKYLQKTTNSIPLILSEQIKYNMELWKSVGQFFNFNYNKEE